MKIQLTIKELKTLEKVKGGYEYRLNGDMKRGIFKTEEEAVQDAEKQLLNYVRQLVK